MSNDIFIQETKILEQSKELSSGGTPSASDYSELVSNYGKLLRTTRKIIKLSDKNEQRQNQHTKEQQ